MYETFEHTADLGLRVSSETLEGLFVDAARGMFAMIVPELTSVELRQTVPVTLKADQSDYLLFDWLNELLYRFDAQRLLLAGFEVTLDENGLSALAQGEVYDPLRHQLEHEVKAVTYHGLSLKETDKGWEAELIVDI
ncbi:MAG: archease [Pirellulales bacterium]|nr:archease [Pirellulales bacterium]